MIIQHIGHAEFLIETESGMRIVTDPFDEKCGYPIRKVKADTALVSHEHHDHNALEMLEGLQTVINKVGEYTPAQDVHITALKSWHDNEKGSIRGETLLFLIRTEGLKIVHLGDLGCIPEEELIRQLMRPDVLMIPVGGYYTIDGKTAKVIADKLHPRVILPMHYKTEYNANWPISGPEEFLENISYKDIRRDIEILRITEKDMECQPTVALFKA